MIPLTSTFIFSVINGPSGEFDVAMEYPEDFIEACKAHIYDLVFILPTWEKIHVIDQERYETFDQAKEIEEHLVQTYKQYGYSPIPVPTGPVEDRAQFIINTLTS